MEDTYYDDAPLEPKHYKWTFIATIGDILDGGMFVATGVTLIPLIAYLHLNSFEEGLPALLTLLGTAFGALSLGPLGDKYGRKYIYRFDLILYALAAFLLALTTDLYYAMIFFFLVGLAVGGDVPISWSLISEFSPKKHRGKLFSFTYISWFIGIDIVIILGILLTSYGMVIFRTIWIVLAVIAVIGFFLRRKLIESPRFDLIDGISKSKKHYKKMRYKELFKKYKKAVIFSWFLYLMAGIPLSTGGEFYPFIFKTLGFDTVQSYEFELLYNTASLFCIFFFTFFVDKLGRVKLYIISAAVYSFGLYMLVDPALYHILPYIIAVPIISGAGIGLGFDIINRLFSIVHFPTSLRSSGQGFIWSTMRFEAAFFGLFTPTVITIIAISGLYAMLGSMILLDLIVIIIFSIINPSWVKTENRSIDDTSKDYIVEE
ncbi:MFS transporter [Acidiplasma aeolicum]|jgi:inositol transporter-like SP family MFS transporter|uniref:MFS transporter n=1 Tax=Acidiplasma aeolicum TaxID=507754 RepID=UPI00370F9784